MSTDLNDKAAVEHKLWEEIAQTGLGMLAVVDRPQSHFQPMTAFGEPESGKIWFYASAAGDLALSAEGGAEGLFVFVSHDRQLQASMRGVLRPSLDRVHIDKFWSSTVAAWFPKGRDDQNLVMLCLDCADAVVWISDAGSVRFGLEIARANLTGSRPNVGGKVSLDLD